MTPSAKFWDGAAEKYARDPISNIENYEEKLRRTQAHFTPESLVLELGCGTGSTALVHAPHVKHVHATDISGAMLDIARGKAADAGIENVTFEQLSTDDVKPEPGSYDVVMAMSVLHLLNDCRPAIQMAFDALKPGGVLITSTFLGREDFMWLLWPVLRLGRAFGKLPDVRFFNAATLRSYQEDIGFTILDEWKPGPRNAVFMIAQKPA